MNGKASGRVADDANDVEKGETTRVHRSLWALESADETEGATACRLSVSHAVCATLKSAERDRLRDSITRKTCSTRHVSPRPFDDSSSAPLTIEEVCRTALVGRVNVAHAVENAVFPMRAQCSFKVLFVEVPNFGFERVKYCRSVSDREREIDTRVRTFRRLEELEEVGQ